jgi:anti-sigma regulatory factor (Ser/Thr protein kinase)
MDNSPHIRFPLSDRSYVSIVKKEIKKIAEEIKFDKKRLSEIEIIVSEITSNIIKHSVDGYVLVKHFYSNTNDGIEILSIDNGPGMASPSHMLKDGVSTTNTLGQGLGAIKRLSDDFDIYSQPKWGTILLSRVYRNAPKDNETTEAFSINTVMIPKKGEVFCGDGFKYIIKKNTCKILAFDGLGHGKEAQKATEAAVASFQKVLKEEPGDALRIIHKEIKSTRGGVGMIFSLDSKANSMAFCGVGNISARIFGEGKLKNCISYNGIIGHTFPTSLHTNNNPWNKDNLLIITSDGLTSRWDAQVFTAIQRHDPTVIAAYLFKEYSRGIDDSLVMILKSKK